MGECKPLPISRATAPVMDSGAGADNSGTSASSATLFVAAQVEIETKT